MKVKIVKEIIKQLNDEDDFRISHYLFLEGKKYYVEALRKHCNLTETFSTDLEKEVSQLFLILRRVYDEIEMSHLNDNKLSPTYVTPINFGRKLGEDIFNYLSAKDQFFRDVVIKRQKKFRQRLKNEIKVYKIREYDYIASPNFRKAKRYVVKNLNYDPAELEIILLTDEQMNTLKFVYGKGENTRESCTFKERLEELKDIGPKFPELFASTEA